MVIMSGKNNRDKVAALAGVSSATVSRVYNNPERVSESRRKSVLDAAKALGYSPDKSASALRRRGTGQVSLVRFEKKDRPWYWGDFPASKWFFTDALTGILPVVDSSMFRLNLKTLRSPDDVERIRWEKECDGVLFYDVDEKTEAQAAQRMNVPAVLSHHTSQFRMNHCVTTDNFEGGRLASSHLKEAGYSHPVYISYLPEAIIPNRDRYRGFCSGWGQDIHQIITDPGKEGGYNAALSILGDLKSGRIDCIAVVNDMTAIGVIQCLQDHKLKPGKDLGLIGYDNMPLNYVLPFRMATVDLQPSLIYEEAAKMLLEIIADPERKATTKTILPLLIPGDTV
ncbi:LacI family transcriptional regulator [Oceanispirochaeta crateris]|uniref:LacI family transcriptional regulator n=2 Tax=Oceanispirochaeta crateris TaxID=2518645 RepID=A0A5C1QMQ9_9SPIO|nr:LacI family transcriptional regulator [Oceanispirochaeta crateris]